MKTTHGSHTNLQHSNNVLNGSVTFEYSIHVFAISLSHFVEDTYLHTRTSKIRPIAGRG